MYKILSLFLLLVIVCGCNNTNNTSKSFSLSVDTLAFKELNYTDSFQQIVFCKNSTNVKIRILQIENGCGCTSGILKDSVIETNDSVPILIKYIPSYSKDSGAIIKYLTIRSNSSPPFKNIIIKGNVIK